jgi:hypothetical protein
MPLDLSFGGLRSDTYTLTSIVWHWTTSRFQVSFEHVSIKCSILLILL